MNRLQTASPILIMLYGFPGSGKTFMANQLSDELGAAHVQDNRIRYELFETPRFDKQENDIVHHLMQYMTEEFLSAGVSVIYDTNAMRRNQRHQLRELARTMHAKPILIWLQIDLESSWQRASKRDKRKADDKINSSMDRETFDQIVSSMQNPSPTEDYIVVSGKHTYQSQRTTLLKKLYDANLINSTSVNANVAKPGMVNLIPHSAGGRVDLARRNITIR